MVKSLNNLKDKVEVRAGKWMKVETEGNEIQLSALPGLSINSSQVTGNHPTKERTVLLSKRANFFALTQAPASAKCRIVFKLGAWNLGATGSGTCRASCINFGSHVVAVPAALGVN